MKTIESPSTLSALPEVILIEPKIFPDTRGCFLETYQKSRYQALGIVEEFRQDNYSRSHYGVLRGLHLQPGQSKLVRCTEGRIFDVVVDVRPESPTYKRYKAAFLSSFNHNQLYVPDGFAHGFLVLSDEAVVEYKCSEEYDPSRERTIAWNDRDLAVPWPFDSRLGAPTVSERDAKADTFAEYVAFRNGDGRSRLTSDRGIV